MKKISIITICYNEKDVEKTCKSVVSQTYQNFEWIIIDGGSSSPCIDILNKYKTHASYFVSEKDGGIYNAMNKGIRVANGEYLLFLNAGDCLYDETVLEDIIPCLTADIVYGNSRIITPQKDIIVRTSFKFNPEFFCTSYRLVHQSTFIRKSLFMQYGLYDESYKCASDFKAFLLFLCKYKCSHRYVDRFIDIFKGYDGISSTTTMGITESQEILTDIFGKRILYTFKLKNWLKVHIHRWLISCIPNKKIRKKLRVKK